MKIQLYPTEYVKALTALASAGESLAHIVERRNPTDPGILSTLRLVKERAATYRATLDEIVAEVITEDAAIHRATEASITAVHAELEKGTDQ